jgi:hypothetical protein
VPGEEQRRSSEGQRDASERSLLAWMRRNEFVGCGDRGDLCHHQQVEVGVVGAGQPARVLGGGEAPTGGLRAAGEVDLPRASVPLREESACS